jgi:hypothetical protein
MTKLFDPAGAAHMTGGGEPQSVIGRYGWVHVALPLVSLMWVVVGLGLGVVWMAEVGMLGLAVTILAIGALAIRERRVLIWQEHVSNRVAIQVYCGVAALPMGLAGVVGGLSLLALVLAHAQGVSIETMRSAVLARPGLALVPLGAFLVLAGLGFLGGVASGKDRDKGRLFNAMLSLPSRLGGLILMAWGVAAAGIGAFELLQPEAFDRALAAVFGARP